MSRVVKFLIITLTLGRIKWLMRLTWLWRFIVFLGVTSWFAKLLRRAVGFDRKASTEIDSAWADALRYTPQASTAPSVSTTAPAVHPAASVESTQSAQNTGISESTSEVTGVTADGNTETITIHEVDAGNETESIVRIEDDHGRVETLVTDTSVDKIDLANLGTSATEPNESAVEETTEPEIIAAASVIEEIETAADIEVIEFIEILEAPESPAPSPEAKRDAAKHKRTPKAKPAPEQIEEPLEITDEDPDRDMIVEPDWIRGDGTSDCPESHPVKAKANSMIYYLPESGHYDRTIPDVCFASDLDAESAGYRPPRR